MNQFLVIDHHVISEDPMVILKAARAKITNGKIDYFSKSSTCIKIKCPCHANGHEHRASCYLNTGNPNASYLWMHCFTCGTTGDFVKFLSYVFDSGIQYAKQWLIDNFGEEQGDTQIQLDEIDLTPRKNQEIIIDESIINKMDSYHPYMTQRKLTADVIKNYEIKYDSDTKCIVFPVRNREGKLIALTRRSVESKRFIIDKDFDKKNIYLLNEVIKNNEQNVYITESQINALTLRGYGYNAIALFGAGAPDNQIDELNHTNVKHFILSLDNDEAGHKGTAKLCKCLSRDKFIDVVLFNDKRDVNDLTKEEFDKLKVVDRSEYLHSSLLLSH